MHVGWPEKATLGENSHMYPVSSWPHEPIQAEKCRCLMLSGTFSRFGAEGSQENRTIMLSRPIFVVLYTLAAVFARGMVAGE